MSYLEKLQEDTSVMNFSNEEFLKNNLRCMNDFIANFKYQKINDHFERLEIHSPLCDYVKKLNESSIKLLNNTLELFEKVKVDFETDSRFFIFDQVNCDTLDVYFRSLFNLIDNHYSFCNSADPAFNSKKRAIDLIKELNQILSGIFSMCDKLKLSKLELENILQNESAEKIINFYQSFNQDFEKLLLDYVGDIHAMVFEMVFEFEINFNNKVAQKLDECAIKCQKVLEDNIININSLNKNLDENKKSIHNDKSIRLSDEEPNFIDETYGFDGNIKNNIDINDGNEKIELLDNQRNVDEENKDQYNFSYDYYDNSVEEPYKDPFDSFSDDFLDTEEEYFDKLDELFNKISDSEAPFIRSNGFKHLDNKTTNLTEAKSFSIKTNSSTIGSEDLSANAYNSFYLYSMASIIIISFAGIIGGFIAYYRSQNKRTKKVNGQDIEGTLL